MRRSAVIILILLSPFFTELTHAQESIISDSLNLNNYVDAQELYDYVKILSSEEFEGRLSGHIGFDKSADWLTTKLKSFGIKPFGENSTYLQKFPYPYTEVFEGCSLSLSLSNKHVSDSIQYKYIDEFIPGSTSADGETEAEVVYVGYGITAPELGYDDYAKVDVKGKIVLTEREAPVSTSHEDFLKWRPYTFHQYKHANAIKHGALGMLYIYPIANPNNSYSDKLILSHIGNEVSRDIFEYSGKKHSKTLKKINKKLKPRSFRTGQIARIKNNTKHHPEGIGSNVIAVIEGSDPELKNEYIMLGGHLDHLGKCYTTMPGAHDNASSVSVTMGVAKALLESKVKLKRSVIFFFSGAEEAGLGGVQYFLKNPVVPLNKIVGYINMDGVGIGNKFGAVFGKNYPNFFSFIENSNKKAYEFKAHYSPNSGRPRLDAAFFDWYGIPVLSLYSSGTEEDYKNYRYHTPYDNISNINSQLMFDLAEIIFHAVIKMANEDNLNIKRGTLKSEFIK